MPIKNSIPFLIIFLCSVHTLNAQTIDDRFSKDHVINDLGNERCQINQVQSKLATADPIYAAELKKYLEEGVPSLSKMENNARSAPIITIPVVFHIVHNGEPIGTGPNISDALIQNAMDILNEDFTAMNPGSANIPQRWQDESGNPEIEFCFAISKPNGDPTNGINRVNMAVTGTSAEMNNIDSEIKPAIAWNPNLYMNIYVVSIPGTTNNGGVLGWAFFPTPSTIGAARDGIVADFNWVGGNSDRTITHEVGHYLGLPHTFAGQACASDDNIADTPNMENGTSSFIPGLSCPNTNFPTGPTSCTEEHMFINYMDYVNDQRCYLSFSNNQINIMRAVLDGTAGQFGFGSRLPLANSTPTVCSFFNNDVGISNVIVPGFQICGTDPVTPEVQIKNFGLNPLTSCMISYELDNGTPVDYAWTGNLGTGAIETVLLPSFTPPTDTVPLSFYTFMPNGANDEQLTNDTINGNVSTILKENLPLLEDFESSDGFPSANGIRILDVQGDGLSWVEATNVSAYGVGSGTAFIDNFSNDLRGTLDAMLTPVYDFTNVSGATLTFDIAYAAYDASFFDSLVVLVSTDCGGLYNQPIYLNGNVGMATAPNSTSGFVPSASQWRTESIPLDAYDGASDVSFAFLNLPGFGNRIFIDNINVSAPINCKPIVNNILNDGAGSLRKAIEDVCVGDTINFDLTLTGATIQLSGSEIVIDKNLTIEGLGMDNLFISGENNSRIFKINSGATLNLNELNIINPNAAGSILNQGTLNVKNVRVE